MLLDRALHGLPPSDRALARALVGGALRHLPGLDALIDSACRQPLPADSRARQALRVALVGRLILDTPPHAAIATALPLVEGGPRRLVHGVLSTLFREQAVLPPVSLPEPWAARWQAAWGADVAAAAARRLGDIPPTDLCLKQPADTAAWAARLGGVLLMPGHVRLAGSRAVETLEGFEDGDWWVQDIAASMPARLLGDVQGLAVLDLCAAPGGKTMQLASAGAQVTALDINGARLKRLRANLARTGLEAEIVEADARTWEPGRQFDAILLDAPCSATGTFGRHPDLLYTKGALDLAPLVALQAALMDRAAGWLKPGGRLVYAVCSLEPAEGEGGSPPAGLASDPVGSHELPDGLLPGAGGTVRTLPGLWGDAGGADGFFISRWRKA
jgi:16S rRNA (cytosine967-C5)-methyltransferase